MLIFFYAAASDLDLRLAVKVLTTVSYSFTLLYEQWFEMQNFAISEI